MNSMRKETQSFFLTPEIIPCMCMLLVPFILGKYFIAFFFVLVVLCEPLGMKWIKYLRKKWELPSENKDHKKIWITILYVEGVILLLYLLIVRGYY